MGVPLNTLLTFFLYQILGLGPVSGLPFASISSIPSLKALEPLPTDEPSSNLISKLDNTENLIPSSLTPGTLSSKSCKLFIGSPDVNINIFSSKSPSLLIGFSNEQTSTSDIPNTKLFTSFNLQSNIASPNIDPVSPVSLIDKNLDDSSTSGLSIIPTLNVDFNSDNFKRELRDTISVLEPCNANPNFASSLRPGFTPNYVINSPSSSFPLMPSLISDEEDSDTPLSAVMSDCSCSNPGPCQCSSLLTNPGPSASFQNNFVGNHAFQSSFFPNRNLPQNSLSNECTENCEINNDTPTGSLFKSLSSFEDVKRYIDSIKCLQLNSGNKQNQPNIETNISPYQVNQMNNNLMYAKALQNKITTEQSGCQTATDNIPIFNNYLQNSQSIECSCENQNILNIRNNVIPKLQLDDAVVKNVAQNTEQINNIYSLGCPQLQTVSAEDNLPVNQINNIALNRLNNCFLANNNIGNTGPAILTFNNAARMYKDNLNNNNANCEIVQNNNNQGCPQLMSIPVYNRDSLQNEQIIRFSNFQYAPNQSNNLNYAQTLLDNSVQFGNNNIIPSQNNEGCPDLLTIAQNKLNGRNNYDTNINVVSIDETLENLQSENNCNAVQTFVPNDNLAQALKLINDAKLNQPVKCPAASINILPFGQTFIDGSPVPNNLVKLEPPPGPDSCNLNNFLTIQDVSKPLPFVPVNPFSYCTPSEVPVNTPTNVILSSPFNLIDNVSPFFTNTVPPVINIPPAAPTIRPMELPFSQFFVSNQDVLCNNVQPFLTLIDNNANNCPANPFLSSNFVSIQSLPEVSFVNSIPSSTISIAPTVSMPDNFISYVPNVPSACTSVQPLLPSSYINPLITSSLQQTNSVSEASALFPCLNNIVSTLTQNIISTLKTKIPSAGIPLALPPVNPYVLTEHPSAASPFCLNTASNLPRSLPDIPVACNEYLPPLTLIPLTSFNSNLFCTDSDETSDYCAPFALSKTDTYYPELSFVVPSVASSDCSCLSGPLFMPVSSLPQSSSVLKINNTGREAKCFEQFVKSVIL